jgi:hypothetical protein
MDASVRLRRDMALKHASRIFEYPNMLSRAIGSARKIFTRRFFKDI